MKDEALSAVEEAEAIVLQCQQQIAVLEAPLEESRCKNSASPANASADISVAADISASNPSALVLVSGTTTNLTCFASLT